MDAFSITLLVLLIVVGAIAVFFGMEFIKKFNFMQAFLETAPNQVLNFHYRGSEIE